jgi:hypothetical protein
MGTDAWHRRHAIQIAAALPEDEADALIVLDLARKLVETYLFPPQRDTEDLERERGKLVSLSSATKGVSR